MVRALPDKQCLSDPMPTHVLKSSVDILAPFLSRLFCWSLEHGVVPLKMKAAHITTTLKKVDLDPTDAKSYRPISNLSVLSKLLERLVAKQLVTYLRDNSLLPDRHAVCIQGAPLDGTVVLRVLADILLVLDSGSLAVLTLLDLSAAFDSVYHDILLWRLQTSGVVVPERTGTPFR